MPVPRTFKVFTCGTSAQPLIGTTLSSAITAHPETAQTIPVADSSMFVNSDTVLIVPASGGVPVYEYPVQIQVVSATQIRAVFTKPHNSGDFVILSFPCANVPVQCVKSSPPTSSIFLGNTANLTTSGAGAFYDVGLSLYFQPPASGWTNADNTSNYWIIAASGTQSYLPAAWTN